jgi:hypothetical protein
MGAVRPLPTSKLTLSSRGASPPPRALVHALLPSRSPAVSHPIACRCEEPRTRSDAVTAVSEESTSARSRNNSTTGDLRTSRRGAESPALSRRPVGPPPVGAPERSDRASSRAAWPRGVARHRSSVRTPAKRVGASKTTQFRRDVRDKPAGSGQLLRDQLACAASEARPTDIPRSCVLARAAASRRRTAPP